MKLGDLHRRRSTRQGGDLAVTNSVNRVETDYPRDITTHARFSIQARLTPDTPAMSDANGARNYRELDLVSDGLASHLASRGVGPEQVVGVMLDDTFLLLTGLLGILKAGGVYLPMDQKIPPERISYLLEDTAAQLILTEESYLPRLVNTGAVPAGVRIIVLQENSDRTDALESETHPATEVDYITLCPVHTRVPERSSPDALAYVIYTSGTTGRPKGVMVPHRAILRLVLNTNYADLRTPQRIMQTGALSFDASTFEIWGALLNGGCLCRPPEHAALDAAELKEQIRAHGATAMFVTTGLFNQLVEMDTTVFDGLSTLLTGGERTSVYHVNKVKTAVPQVALANVYGPTENTTFTSYYPIRELQNRDVPIGGSIANTEMLILDSRHAVVPIGVAGEICTGGDGLARGYMADPALTAEKFIPHPLRPGERVYRTGDWGRCRADGTIEFLGRRDQQVKIRGYRIEPGEIEMRLMEHPGVREAAVVAGEVGKEAAVLTAYLTGASAIDLELLQKHLRSYLPEYMIPSAFVRLEKMPLTANGKFDRAALPAAEESETINRTKYVEPSTELERTLVDIWNSVLGRKDVGVTDDFFAAGGHSLEVTRLVSAIEEKLGVAVPLSVIFRPATIRDLGQYILDAAKFGVAGIDDAVVCLSRSQEGPPIFAFPPGTGDALGYIQLAELLRPYSFHAFNFLEADTRLCDYADIISTIDCDGPYVLLGYSAGGNLAFHVAIELERRGRRVSDIVMIDSWQCRRKIVFPEGEVDSVAAAFLNHESVAPYLSSPILREKAYRIIERYYRYMSEALDLETGAANMHLILADSVDDAAANYCLDDSLSSTGWAEVTTGAFTTYAGCGGHRVMLNPPHLEHNAALVRSILDRVCSKQPVMAGGVTL